LVSGHFFLSNSSQVYPPHHDDTFIGLVAGGFVFSTGIKRFYEVPQVSFGSLFFLTERLTPQLCLVFSRQLFTLLVF